MPAEREGTALVLLGGLGDTVQALPVAAALRRAAPARPLTWVVPPLSARLLQGQGTLGDAVAYDRKGGWRALLDLWRRTRRLRPERVLNLERYLKGLPPALLLGGRRLGLDRPHGREGVWLFHHDRVHVDPPPHERELYLAFLERLGVRPPPPEERHLAPTAEERAAQAAFLDRLAGRLPDEGPLVGLVLASGRPAKDWPANRSARLAGRLTRELGARVLLVGGTSPREEAAAGAVRREAEAVVDARGGDVRRLVWLLDACAACVAPDTGPLHVAAEVGTPVVGLYGHTNPWRVGPHPVREERIVDRYTRPDEAPHPGRSEPRHGNMERIGVEEVVDRVTGVLDAGGRARRT